MKKGFLLKSMLLLCALIVGSSSVWGQTTDTYVFTAKDWKATLNNVAANWTSGKDGNQMQSGRGVQITSGASGANATSPKTFTNISKIVVVYSTNASSGAGTINLKVGSNTEKSFTVTTEGGISDRDAEFNFSPNETGKVKLTINCTQNSIYIKSIAITTVPSIGIQTKVDVLNYTKIGVTGTGYSSWTGITDNSDAVYAGNSAGGNTSIQLRSNNNSSGIVTTTSGGLAKKVIITWNSNTITTSDRTIDVYGKNVAYESAADLYDTNKQGTLIGSIARDATELTVDNDYEYIGIRSRSGALYLDEIQVTWELPNATIPINSACTDGTLYYGTFCCSKAFVVPANLVISEISVIDGGLYVESYSTGAVVPKNTGVMVAAEAGGNYSVTLSSEDGISVLGDDNCLRPSGDAGITAAAMAAADASCLYYRLTMHNGTQIGYWWGAAAGAAFAIAANKAYLAVPQGSAPAMGFGFDDDTTGIQNIERTISDNQYYTLDGRRVAQPTKGLYILNGKKIVVK